MSEYIWRARRATFNWNFEVKRFIYCHFINTWINVENTDGVYFWKDVLSRIEYKSNM